MPLEMVLFWQEGENPKSYDPICREECQQSPHDYSLHYICDDGSPEYDGEHSCACISYWTLAKTIPHESALTRQ
jgi:hypothetical protein